MPILKRWPRIVGLATVGTGARGGGGDAAGDLECDRLHTHQKLQRKQQHRDQCQDIRAAINSKRRWKTIHKTMRDRYKG